MSCCDRSRSNLPFFLVWLRCKLGKFFQDGGTMLPFLCSCQLSEIPRSRKMWKRHGGSSGCSHDIIEKKTVAGSQITSWKSKGVSAIFAFSLLFQIALVYTTNYIQLKPSHLQSWPLASFYSNGSSGEIQWEVRYSTTLCHNISNFSWWSRTIHWRLPLKGNYNIKPACT